MFILLKDASNATTVFEGLNDPGIPIGIGDLVRNEVFSTVSNDPSNALSLHQQVWLPFRDSLGDSFDDYFFPFGIVKEPSIRRADLFRGLRKVWADSEDPREIVRVLEEYREPFLAIVEGAREGGFSPPILDRLRKLRDANAPSSTYPFLMRLLREYQLQRVSSQVVHDCCAVIESFLVRRALVGLEPTGLLVFFRSAWSAMDGEVSAEKLAAALQKRTTIEWPDDHRVLQAVETRRLYNSGIKNHFLAEYDRSLGGDVPSDIPWIEHVLPQNLNPFWEGQLGFTRQDHESLVHTAGNLLPLSKPMNQAVSDGPYVNKRAEFGMNSMYASARRVAENNAEWTPQSIKSRSRQMAEWAIAHWPRPEP